jgi:hypothetical protein
MTITKIFQVADYFPPVLGIICLALPLIAAIVFRLIHGKGRGGETPWKYLYSVTAYAACASGLYCAIIPAYIVQFSEEPCPDVRFIWFYWPGIIMVLTLIQVARTLPLSSIPGWKRYYLPIPMIAVSLVVPLFFEKEELIEMSLYKYAAIALVVFMLLQGIAWAIFGRRKGAATTP